MGIIKLEGDNKRYIGVSEISAVIFDFWGTLAKSYSSSETRRDEISRIVGVQPNEWDKAESDAMTTNFGTIDRYIEFMAGIFSTTIREKLKEYIEDDIRNSFLYDEVKECLRELKERYNFRLGLLSNTTTPYIEVFHRLGLNEMFQPNAVCFSPEIRAKKPKKKAYEIVLQRLKTEPSRTLMIGDNFYDDIHGATEAGIVPVLIKRRVTPPEFVKKIDNSLVSNLNELIEKLK